MSSEIIQQITINFENKFDKDLIFTVEKDEDGLHIKFLNNLREYVAYKPFVLTPKSKIYIDYKLTK